MTDAPRQRAQTETVVVLLIGVIVIVVESRRRGCSRLRRLVVVESDPQDDGTSEGSSDATAFDGSETYAVTGLSVQSARYRLRIEPSSGGPTAGPTVSAITISQ